MPTDAAVLDRTLTVMAICMAIQTVLFVIVAIGAFVAWRRAAEGMTAARMAAEQQILELRTRLDQVVETVDDAAQALIRSAATVDDAVTDARQAVGSVTSSVGSVAKTVTNPQAALAIGLWRGFQFLRKRRAAQ